MRCVQVLVRFLCIPIHTSSTHSNTAMCCAITHTHTYFTQKKNKLQKGSASLQKSLQSNCQNVQETTNRRYYLKNIIDDDSMLCCEFSKIFKHTFLHTFSHSQQQCTKPEQPETTTDTDDNEKSRRKPVYRSASAHFPRVANRAMQISQDKDPLNNSSVTQSHTRV